MNPFIALTRLTFSEFAGQRIYRILLLALLLIPWLLLIPASLFMFDIGKVIIDLLFTAQHFWLLTFLFFIVAPLIGRDIEQGTCQLFLTLPMPRSHYLWARYLGIAIALLPLLAVWLVSGVAALLFASGNWSGYVDPAAWQSFAIGSLLIMLPYLALTALLILIAAFATGLPETTVFLFSAWLLCWSLPPVLAALDQSELAAKTSETTIILLQSINQLLPDLTSARISLLLAHGQPLDAMAIIAYCSHHLAYAILAILLAVLVFRRRDLA